MKASHIIVPVDQLIQEPYASVLCFPNANEVEAQSRLIELRSHGVSALEFSGAASVFGVAVPVLGKGFVGIVVIAHLNGQRVAVKIRRADADRADLLHEAAMLSKANSVDAAPKLIAASKNFLLMQLIDGDLLPNWLKTNKDKDAVKQVLGQILEQCYKLDQVGLDHGELSKAPKHLLVDKAKKTFIVDFETASLQRRVANVTAVCQYLFGGNSSAAKILDEIFGEKNRLELIAVLKAYKKNKTRENFESLLKFCFS
ncbi:MAG: RIO1 family regulatory kinase/ATPase [Candidatus Bathyarchaeia archaeon]